MREIIQQIIKNYLNRQSFYSDLGIVLSVESDTATIQIVKDDLEHSEVKIQASTGLSEGIYIKPRVGSYVVVSYMMSTSAYISLYSEIDQITITLGSHKFDITTSEIAFNDGNNGGIPITGNVINRLNLIEQDINSLKSILSGWTPVASDGGAALKTALTGGGYYTPLTQSQDSDIEGEVKH